MNKWAVRPVSVVLLGALSSFLGYQVGHSSTSSMNPLDNLYNTSISAIQEEPHTWPSLIESQVRNVFKPQKHKDSIDDLMALKDNLSNLETQGYSKEELGENELIERFLPNKNK